MGEDDLVSELDILNGALIGTECRGTTFEQDSIHDEVQDRNGSSGGVDGSDDECSEVLEEVEEVVECNGDDDIYDGSCTLGWFPHKSEGFGNGSLGLGATWRRPRQRVRIPVS